MYMQFLFKEGNPYITKTPEEAFKIFCKYDTLQIGDLSFLVTGIRSEKPTTYYGKRNLARNMVIDWQINFDRYSYCYSDLFTYQEFFETIGKKYGLIKEFRENAII